MTKTSNSRRQAALSTLSLAISALGANLLLPAPAIAQKPAEIRIALIASKSGPLEAYAKQTIIGFNLGLDYATGGSFSARSWW